MDLNFCGGANEVGASCILVKISNKNILFDCGMRMSKDPIPDLDSIKKSGGIDLIIVSHAHMDHIGTLPIISTEYPNAQIIMTHMTKDLVKVLLYDSLKIMDMRESEIPIFSEIHVQNMLNRIICYSPEYEIHPFNDDLDIKVTLFSAGHIPGAVFTYIVSKEASIFYSGDFSITDQMTVSGAYVPKLRPDVGIFESTYGNRLHNNRDIELNSLLNKIVETVSLGNKILIPAFALGRAQEIILYLINSMQKGTCPKFKIYVDGMVNDICRVFNQNPNYLRERYAKKIYKGIDIFYNENVIPVKRNEATRREIALKDEGLCIISSSGMLSGGPSAFYAKHLALNENNFIALTGYQDEESPGAKLLELANNPEDENKKIQLGDEIIPLKCGIGMYGLSAHADKSQILALAHSLSPKKAFFVHGSKESCLEISSSFQKEHFGETYIPENGEHYYFDFTKNKRRQLNRESLKTMNTYFKSIDDVSEEEIISLWEFIKANYPQAKGFTLEDLAFILTGKFQKHDLMEFNKKLYESKYFVFEVRRPYIFHYVKPEDIKIKDEFMEVNKALNLASEMFSPYGLYKKGARFNEKVILLNFNFPITATLKIIDKIKEYEDETKWKIEINNECSLGACESLIESLLPEGINFVKAPSYYRLDNCFRININSLDFNYKDIEEAFLNETGINLYFYEINSKPNEALPIIKVPGQTEQNAAFSAIDSAFKDKPDKLFKKSLKSKGNENYIELCFISPEIGEKYASLIDKLETQLRWNIEISNSVNQNEILKIGKKILESNQIEYKKLSYIAEKKKVKVNSITSPTDELKQKLNLEFKKITGLSFEL